MATLYARIYRLDGERPVRTICIPLWLVQLVARYVPVRLLDRLNQDIDGEEARELLQAINQILREIERRQRHGEADGPLYESIDKEENERVVVTLE